MIPVHITASIAGNKYHTEPVKLDPINRSYSETLISPITYLSNLIYKS